MDLKVNPTNKLNGEITAPGSKSYSHRAFIIASFAKGVSVIKNALTTGDVAVTMRILKELGVNIHKESDNSYIIKKMENFLKPVDKIIDCKNSGTSIRIFSALSLLIEGGLSLSGEFLKRNRPLTPLLDALTNLGGVYELLEDRVIIKRGQKICQTVKIRGDISSQFITALLIASCLLECQEKKIIEIEITTPLVSYPFILITIDVLQAFGANLSEIIDLERKGSYFINTSQTFRPQVYEIPGDFSSAAFIIVAACLLTNDSKVEILNLNMKNPQGDKEIIDILKKMGANIILNQEKNSIIIQNNNPLNGIEIDCVDIPDLFPILSVVGAFAKGKTVLFNASNLRLKESDRISVMARELTKMDVKVEEEEDKLTIFYCENIKSIQVDHEDDHRVAMACCVASLLNKSSTIIRNIQIVNDSYPNFVEDLKKLGANIEIE